MSFLRKILGLQVLFCISFLAQTGSCFNLGNECWNAISCNHWNLKCENFQCVCWEPYVSSVNKSACVIPNGVRCTRNDDVCYDPNASCQLVDPDPSVFRVNTCRCNAGFFENPETKACEPAVGTECAIDGPPCFAGSCVDGKCQCDNGLVPSTNGELCGAPLFGLCNDGVNPDCASPNAECHPQFNTCQCKSGRQSVLEPNGVLDCKMSLGGTCTNVTECASTNTICEELRHKTACTCQFGYVPSESRTACLEVTNQWPGECQENRQCSAMFGRHSVCQSNSCACVNGFAYFAEDNVCVHEHAAATASTFEGIKLLASTLLPHLPSEAKIAVEDALNAL